ncbi:MAG: alpha/beta hydrolase [Thermoanaerobaculia bacterium]
MGQRCACLSRVAIPAASGENRPFANRTNRRRAGIELPVTKIYATNDGVAPSAKVLANRSLLPETTKWVAIEGGNHSQFGNYGHQLFDGKASISREKQQSIVGAELLASLKRVASAAQSER